MRRTGAAGAPAAVCARGTSGVSSSRRPADDPDASLPDSETCPMLPMLVCDARIPRGAVIDLVGAPRTAAAEALLRCPHRPASSAADAFLRRSDSISAARACWSGMASCTDEWMLRGTPAAEGPDLNDCRCKGRRGGRSYTCKRRQNVDLRTDSCSARARDIAAARSYTLSAAVLKRSACMEIPAERP